jgi:hypothetical protein
VGGAVSGETCTCGNPGVLRCEGCRAFVCRLCVRKDGKGSELCLACRAFSIDREEARASGAQVAGTVSRSLTRPIRVQRHVVLLPAVVAGALAVMTAIAVPFLADVPGARAEHRAEVALRAIFEAEQSSLSAGTKAYLTLEELERKRLFAYRETPGYELRVELARDRHTFWARAIPAKAGLRGILMDTRGEPIYDQGN